MLKNCKKCVEPYCAQKPNSRYCYRCTTAICIECYNPFYITDQLAKNIVCSKECLNLWKSKNCRPPSRLGIKPKLPPANKGRVDWGVIATCCGCGIGYRRKAYEIVKAKEALYCTPLCRTKYSITPENKRLRRSIEFANWRKTVFERDNYTCQICNERGGELHPDHIKQFAYYPELRFEPSNGRTLCASCHRKTPTWGNRGRREFAK